MSNEQKLTQAKLWAQLRDAHQAIVEAIDEYLNSTAPPEVKEAPATQPAQPEVVPLKSSEGRLLATLYVSPEQLKIVPMPDLKLKRRSDGLSRRWLRSYSSLYRLVHVVHNIGEPTYKWLYSLSPSEEQKR
jgi:hypothetical protein